MNNISNAEITNKKVLLRVDFNVPLNEDGSIEDDKRIRESLPTIEYLLKNGAHKITIAAHLSEPHGKNHAKFSLMPVANHLAKILSLNATFNKPQDIYRLSDPPAGEAGRIVLLENIRFNLGEEENSPEFAKKLAQDQDIFVNDAFGTCHRAHASTSGIAKILPSYAGLLVLKEVENLNKLLVSKEQPFTIVFGGAKIADKLPFLKTLSHRAHNFLIGGAVANTFLAARRHYLGKSLVDKDDYRESNIIWQNITDEPNRNIYLPIDLVISKSIKEPQDMKIVKTSDALSPDYLKEYSTVDIGPKTIEQYRKIITKSHRIFWNGNMGVSEVKEFGEGTKKIAEAIISSSANHIVIGGGDTVAAVEQITDNSITDNLFLSTGGGATLEFLAGKELPGLKALGYYKN